MINLEDILVKLVAELKNSEFSVAVEKAGLNKYEVELILDVIHERGE